MLWPQLSYVKGHKIIFFWDVTPCNVVTTLKMEARNASEILVIIYQTMQQHIPEDYNLRTHCHENLHISLILTYLRT